MDKNKKMKGFSKRINIFSLKMTKTYCLTL